jgi:hypothetical protein
MSRSALRTEPPGQQPCGFYGLPPEAFGVLVTPTAEEFNRWWRADSAFATVHPWRGGKAAEVHMDLLRAGDMPEDTRPWAALAVTVAAYRYIFGMPRGRSVVIQHGATCWGTFCLRADALALALVLVELWWGNDDGARLMLAGAWRPDLMAAEAAGWVDAFRGPRPG